MANIRIVVIAIIALVLYGIIIIFATELHHNTTFAQFLPPSQELFGAQIGASANKTCTLKPSSIKLQSSRIPDYR